MTKRKGKINSRDEETTDNGERLIAYESSGSSDRRLSQVLVAWEDFPRWDAGQSQG